MKTVNLTCIGCPMGCPLTVTIEGDTITVSGNTCALGDKYAKKEVTNPTRVVTSSVGIDGADIARVSVKTENDIPKDKIFEVMTDICKVRVKAPVSIGDVVIENVAGTGVKVIVTKDVPAKN